MNKRIPDDARQRLMEQLASWQLPAEFLTELVDHSHCISYTPSTPVFLRGSTADLLFWVLSGLINVCYPNPNGTRVVVKLAGPGDIIGFADIVEPNGRHTQAFDAEAVTKASVALFTRDHVIKAVQKLPASKLVSLLEMLNSSWSGTNCLYARFLGMSFRERLDLLFADLASRFGVRDSRGILLTPEFSHEALAEMIASSRPMVSRLIGEMVDQGVIARQGKRYILLNRPTSEQTSSSVSAGRPQPVPNDRSDSCQLPQVAKSSEY